MWFLVPAIAAGLLVWRRRHIARLTALSRLRRTLGPDGVVIGGESFVLARPAGPAVLLLHGAGDTPQTLRYVGEALHAAGYHVVAPLLPGHGRSIKEFSEVTADALTGAAMAQYAELRVAHDWVAVIGLSMGGALAAQIGARVADLPALGLVAPYLAMPRPIERAARVAWLWGPLVPLVHAGEVISILDPAERERNLAYGVFTPAALVALRETMRRGVAALPRITAPTLVIHSRADNRIATADAERTFALIGASERRLEWISGAAHVITVDYGRDRVIALLTSWLDAHRVSR
jgi:carboxylesterase